MDGNTNNVSTPPSEMIIFSTTLRMTSNTTSSRNSSGISSGTFVSTTPSEIPRNDRNHYNVEDAAGNVHNNVS